MTDNARSPPPRHERRARLGIAALGFVLAAFAGVGIFMSARVGNDAAGLPLVVAPPPIVVMDSALPENHGADGGADRSRCVREIAWPSPPTDDDLAALVFPSFDAATKLLGATREPLEPGETDESFATFHARRCDGVEVTSVERAPFARVLGRIAMDRGRIGAEIAFGTVPGIEPVLESIFVVAEVLDGTARVVDMIAVDGVSPGDPPWSFGVARTDGEYVFAGTRQRGEDEGVTVSEVTVLHFDGSRLRDIGSIHAATESGDWHRERWHWSMSASAPRFEASSRAILIDERWSFRNRASGTTRTRVAHVRYEFHGDRLEPVYDSDLSTWPEFETIPDGEPDPDDGEHPR